MADSETKNDKKQNNLKKNITVIIKNIDVCPKSFEEKTVQQSLLLAKDILGILDLWYLLNSLQFISTIFLSKSIS